MTHFYCIHGAWHGGWCFDSLRPLLAAQGHQLTAPDLPGMGGDEATLGQVSLAGWADYIADQIRALPEPVVLVGHSRGGIVISEVAQRIPERITALVYVCAMLLPSGMARADLKKIVGGNPPFEAIISPTSGGNGTVVDTSRAGAIFAQLSPPALVEDALKKVVAEPNAPRQTPLHLTDDRYGQVPRHYIECLHDQTIKITDQRAMQAMLPCASVTTLDADHSPFLSTPEALAAALIHIAQGTGQ